MAESAALRRLLAAPRAPSVQSDFTTMLGSLMHNIFVDVFLFENSDPECLRAQREAEIRCREKTEERIKQREITMKSLSLAEYREWLQMERSDIESRQERESARAR